MKYHITDQLNFVTYKELDDDEVYGWLESNHGSIIHGTGGWWRTTKEDEAAERAKKLNQQGHYPRVQ